MDRYINEADVQVIIDKMIKNIDSRIKLHNPNEPMSIKAEYEAQKEIIVQLVNEMNMSTRHKYDMELVSNKIESKTATSTQYVSNYDKQTNLSLEEMAEKNVYEYTPASIYNIESTFITSDGSHFCDKQMALDYEIKWLLAPSYASTIIM